MPIVEHRDVVDHTAAFSRVAKSRRSVRPCLRLPTKRSIRALARQLPLRLIDGIGPCSGKGTTIMDAAWAESACAAWNNTPALVNELGGKAWAANDGGRGYKIIQLYRTKCGEGTKVELEIQNKDGKAHCARGGTVKHATLDPKLDYLMNDSDEDWACIGQGKFGCGAMGAMTTGKLKFKGPKMEAMGVVGPFDNFLRLTGKVAGDTSACPK